MDGDRLYPSCAAVIFFCEVTNKSANSCVRSMRAFWYLNTQPTEAPAGVGGFVGESSHNRRFCADYSVFQGHSGLCFCFLANSFCAIEQPVPLTDLFIEQPSQQRQHDDDALMLRVRKGDELAFRTLYDRYKSQIFWFCYRTLKDRDNTKDAVQEVFILIYRMRAKYVAGTNFAGWIHSIARNQCLNILRTQKDTEPFDELQGYAIAMANETSDTALQDHLAYEVAQLPEIYREALLLREYEGHSYQQIADITGLALSAVKFRIFKARDMLRERLAKRLDEFD